jgi:tRNA A-37 threonylcarbamoyl transferase component Bud32
MKYNKIIDFKSKPRVKSKQKSRGVKSKQQNKVKTKKIKSTYDGGAAFEKGGFGCIFKPALRCKNSDVAPRPNYVSKLIEKPRGKREYMYIYNIKKKLEHLPVNIKRYFLLDNITMCDPGALSDKDKVKIESVCQNILTDLSDGNTNMPITSDTINKNLHKFKIINMPELSMTLSDYIKNMVLSPENLIMLNNIIIQYLTVVIPSMYKNNIVHGDIKPENMMFNASDNNTLVLIDWGLSYIADSDKKNVPDALSALSVQPMHPFSSFLFKKNVIEKYDVFLKDLKKEGVKITRDSLRVFALSEYMNFMSMHDRQISFFNSTFNNVYSDEFAKYVSNGQESYIDETITYNMTMYYIVEYIIDILLAYTVDYKLNLVKYFNEVYIMNIDSWSLMSTYNYLIDKSQTSLKMSSTEHKIFVKKMMYILTENFFKNGNLPINLPKIVSEIKNLNQFLMSLGSKRSSVGMFNKLVTRGIREIRGIRSVSKSRRSVMQPAVAVVNGGYKSTKRTKRRK